MTAMQTLTQLVELKRKATTAEAIDRYAVALYTVTRNWIGTNTAARISALAYDALIDHIAHETLSEGTGADLRVKHAPNAHQLGNADPEPADRRTG